MELFKVCLGIHLQRWLLIGPGQLHAYKEKLTADLEEKLSQADIELLDGMNDLADAFDEKCNVIRDAGQVFRDHISDEVLQVDDRKIMLNEHMDSFKTLYSQKEVKLRALWKEYVEVQKQIMVLAIVVLEDDDIRIANPDTDEELSPEYVYTGGKDPELDEDAAVARQSDFQQDYQDALDEIAGIQAELDDATSEALKKNKEIYKVCHPSCA